MLDLRLRYLGGGKFQAAGRLDFELAGKELDDGEVVRAKITHQRSIKQNAFFHALIAAAWENQRGGPKLPSWEHLKGWLLIQVGHCEVKQFSAKAMTAEVAQHIRRTSPMVDFTTDGESIFMKTAKSVSFKSTSADEMGPIVDAVVSLICTEIVPGVKPEQLLDMAKERAA